MVNTKIVSRYTGALPKDSEADLRIPNGPLYLACDILELLTSDGNKAIKAWTKKCIEDLQKWSLDEDNLLELSELALRSGRFIGAQWCQQNPNGPWAACDAYHVTRNEWIVTAHKEMDIEYYIKFAISKTGKILLFASCHPPKDRN